MTPGCTCLKKDSILILSKSLKLNTSTFKGMPDDLYVEFALRPSFEKPN